MICEVCQKPVPDDEMVMGELPVRIHGEPAHIGCYMELVEIPQ